MLARDVHVCAAGLGVPTEPAGPRPNRYDAFFEFSEDALFLKEAEGVVGFCIRGEGTEGGLGGCTGVYGSFGGDEVVRG